MQSNNLWVDSDAFFQQRLKPFGEIAQVGFFIDQDRGFGMGFTIPGVDSFLLHSSEQICVSSIDSGIHFLHVRALDEDGYWSLMQVDPLIISDVKTSAVFVGNKTVYLDSMGVFSFDDLTSLIDSVVDLCPFDSLWLTDDNFDCLDVDTMRTVVFMGIDMHGAIVCDTFKVAVMDSLNVCCPMHLSINDAVIPNATYGASISVSADGLVPNLGVVEFNAGQQVALLSFFEVELGGDFHAIIENPCGDYKRCIC